MKFLIWLVVALALNSPLWAVDLTAAPTTKTQTSAADTPMMFLSADDIDRALSTLPDEQVRILLRTTLIDKLQTAEPASHRATLVETLAVFDSLLDEAEAGFAQLLSAVPDTPQSIVESHVHFASDFMAGLGGKYIVFLLLSIGLTFTVAKKLDTTFLIAETADNSLPRIDRLKILSRRFGRDTGVALLVTALLVLTVLIAYTGTGSSRDISLSIAVTIGLYFVFRALGKFSFAPQKQSLRLYYADNHQTRALYAGFMIASFVGLAGVVVSAIVSEYTAQQGPTSVIRNVTSTVLAMVLMVTVWRGRYILSAMIIGEDINPSRTTRFVAQAWPAITVAIIFIHWVVIRLTIWSGNADRLSFETNTGTLILLLLIPFAEMIFKIIAIEVFGASSDTANNSSRTIRLNRDLVFLSRIACVCIIFTTLTWLWGHRSFAVPSTAGQPSVSATVINACLVLLGGLIAWKLIAVITDKVLVSGNDNDSEKLSEEPGASGGTRLETVLPLVSRIAQFATAALTFLIVLSVLGVDTAPLLAGAGIVGLAVGFGAQKLVQDIVSGIFFLIDDAFRVGEYLDVGGTMGTVEKISIRSFQLRHHLGAIQTLPFGNISQISNFSRDWSIMKLNLRLTYGTDANKVRKMIKNLGQELLDHPDIGDKFLEPLKSQGVSAMEDSAMIMRVKFRTKPGDQFIVRRFVLDEIHKLFEANDIRFANREVTVHVANHHPESLTNSVIGTASGAAGALLQNDSQTSPATASPKTDQ